MDDPVPEAAAKHFVERVHRLVRLLRYGSREVVLSLAGMLLLFAASKLGPPKVGSLPHIIPKAAEPWISAPFWFAGGIFLLLAARRIWRKVAAPPLPPPIALPALKGAASFGSQDADLFARLERGEELTRLRDWILDDQKPLIVVMGESGVGKTSLLRAGLAHALKADEHTVIYWEAVPTEPGAGLVHAVRSSWGKTEGAPSSLGSLAAAVATGSRVVVIDQLEQITREEHPGIFQHLGNVMLALPPHAATWIVAFRREYAATWRDFELTLPPVARQRIETLSLQLFTQLKARRIVSVLAEQAGLPIDQKVVNEVVDGIAADGWVSPVDIGVTLLGLSQITAEDGRLSFSLDDLRASGGQTGLLTRYMQRVLDPFFGTERDELLVALVELIDLERDQRIAEGKKVEELEKSARPAIPTRFRAALNFLASSKARVLENLAPPTSEPHYRLIHERLIPAVRVLTGSLLDEAKRAGLLLDQAFRAWSRRKSRKFLLSWADLRLVLQYKEQFPWGENEPAKREFVRKSRRQRWITATLLTMGCVAFLVLVIVVMDYQHRLIEKQRMASQLARWGLPADLGERLDQLEYLELPQGIDAIDWLGSAKHLRSLKLNGGWFQRLEGLPVSLKKLDCNRCIVGESVDLPAGLQSLNLEGFFVNPTPLVAQLPLGLKTVTLASTLFGGISSSSVTKFNALPFSHLPSGLDSLHISGIEFIALLAILPRDLKSLDLSKTPITSITGLPLRLHSLNLSESKLDSLPRLPAGLESLDLSGTRISRLNGLPPGLKSLDVSETPITSLTSPLPGLQSLDLSGTLITDLAHLPQGLRSLRICRTRISSLEGLPTSVQTLDLYDTPISNLADLPQGLVSIDLSRTRVKSLVGLPRTLRSLKLAESEITSLAGLPSRLRSLDLSGDQITSFVGVPSGLQSLSVFRTAITSLEGVPRGLQSLDLFEIPVPSLDGLPRGLRSLSLERVGITSLEGLPPGLRSLSLSGREITSLAGLPTGLQFLELSGTGITSLVGLPLGLRSIRLVYNDIDNLDGLPRGLRSLTIVNSSSFRYRRTRRK